MTKHGRDGSTILYIAEIWRLLPEDAIRKGRSTPLDWGKFRSPADGSESGLKYQMRRQAIKAMPEGFAILGIFDELLAHYGFATIAPLRGWLVNYEFSEASSAQVGQAIGCADVELVKRSLEALERVGLLARMVRPDFMDLIHRDATATGAALVPARRSDGSDDGLSEGRRQGRQQMAEGQSLHDPRGGAERKLSWRARRYGRKGSRRRPESGRKVSGQRPTDVSRSRRKTADPRPETADRRPQTPPAASATPPPPAADGCGQTEGENLTAAASARASDPRPQTPQVALAAPAPPAADRPSRDEQAATGDVEADNGQAGNGQAGNGQARDAVPAAPAHHPPQADADAEAGRPTEADPGGTKGHGEAEAFEPASACLDSLEIMVTSIGNALYPTREDLVVEGRKARPMQGPDEFERRERGALMVAWSAVLDLGMGQVELLRLHQRALKEANAVRRKRTNKPKGAAWMHWLNEHMAAAVGSDGWAQARRTAKFKLGSGPP